MIVTRPINAGYQYKMGLCQGAEADKYDLWLEWAVIESDDESRCRLPVKAYLQRNDEVANSVYETAAFSECWVELSCGGTSFKLAPADTRNGQVVELIDTEFTPLIAGLGSEVTFETCFRFNAPSSDSLTGGTAASGTFEIPRALFRINGVALDTPSSLEVLISDVDDTVHTDFEGTTYKQRLAVKRSISCGWPPMSNERMSTLLRLMDNSYFTLKYPDPRTGAQRSGTFYAGDRSVPMYINYGNGNWLWQGLAVDFIER